MGGKDDNEYQLLPILIIPAIAGSGLKIHKSGIGKAYEKERVWMNVNMLAAGRFLSNKVLNEKEIEQLKEMNQVKKISKHVLEDTSGDTDEVEGIEVDILSGPAESSEAEVSTPAPGLARFGAGPDGRPTLGKKQNSFTEVEAAFEVRSSWLFHMSLNDDMVSERRGNRVRPYEGLKAVEYMSGDAVTQIGSWVHAPVTKYLTTELGYVKGQNLDAAPYDWRLPPKVTEERDGYLTKTKERIEELYENNNKLPVVLLCHSMGCKMGHYFLNWARIHFGRDWLDKYIHAYMPVGAPHNGVSLAVRAGLIGQGLSPEVDMMMDGDDEGLVLYRSWGSGCWLMPRILPPHVMPSVVCRREGELVVALSTPVDYGNLFENRKRPKELRLGVVFRDLVAVTDFQKTEPYKDTMAFPETFMFAVPEIDSDDDVMGQLWIFLEEPAVGGEGGGALARSGVKRVFTKATNFGAARMVKRQFRNMSNSLAKTFGSTNKVGQCHPWDLRPSDFKDEDGNKISRDIELLDDLNPKYVGGVSIKIKYNPPITVKNESDWPIAAVSRETKTVLPVLDKQHKKNQRNIKFDVLSGHQVFGMEGFTNIEGLAKQYYESDPVGPKTTSASEAPPVKRVHAIYGYNIPTEVCAVYRHRPYIVIGDDRMDSRYVLDTDCKLDKRNLKPTAECPWDLENYTFDGGKISETKNSVQHTVNDDGEEIEIKRCGDGTVPYWNLAQCKTWRSRLDVLTVDELEGAGHRDILAETRFHHLLKKYCRIEKSKETDG